jgi:hypothetical protein
MSRFEVARILNQPALIINALPALRLRATANECQTNVMITKALPATIGLSGRGPFRIARSG